MLLVGHMYAVPVCTPRNPGPPTQRSDHEDPCRSDAATSRGEPSLAREVLARGVATVRLIGSEVPFTPPPPA
jgi:hypothetical protein